MDYRSGGGGDRRGGRRRPPERGHRTGGKEQDSQDAVANTKQSSSRRPPVILAKPPAPKKIVNDDEEEWPSIAGSSASQSPTRVPVSAVITGKEQSPSFQKRGSIVPVGDERPFSSGGIIQVNHSASTHKEELVSRSKAQGQDASLKGSIRFLTDEWDVSPIPEEYLQEQSTDFLVVGVIGPQGVGKSTLLSFLAGNDVNEAYRGQHQTNGMYFYVNDLTRTILLDTQPILSPSIMDIIVQYDKRFSLDYPMGENYVEAQSLEIASYILQVCHVVFVMVDWFLDLDIVRFLRTADMLRPTVQIGENSITYEHVPKVVFVINRAPNELFTSPKFKEQSEALDALLNDTQLDYKSGLSMLKRFASAQINSPVNLFLLPEHNFWFKQKSAEKNGVYKGYPEYEELIKNLRDQLFSHQKTQIPTALNEKLWYLYAARSWTAVRQSLLISEYGRMLP